MTAAQELLINVFMAGTAISCGQLFRNDEALMVRLFLPCNRLMAVETIHALPRVLAHLVLVNNRVLSSEMAFRTFPACTNKVCGRLFGFHFWSRAVDEKCGQHESKGNHYAKNTDRNDNGTSR